MNHSITFHWHGHMAIKPSHGKDDARSGPRLTARFRAGRRTARAL